MRTPVICCIIAGISLCAIPRLSHCGPRLYWGDLHGHSNLSDGSKSPSWYFFYSRDSSRLDFAALTDHDHIADKQLAGYPWSLLVCAAQAYNEDGSFVAIPGYEWTSDNGHVAVLFSAPVDSIFPASANTSDNITKLKQRLEAAGYPFLCVMPHPSYYPVWYWDWGDQFITAAEIVGWGGNADYRVYEYYGCPSGPHRDSSAQGAYVQDILAYGYRIALVGSMDSHNGKPGRSGLTAVYADTLTRDALFAALRKRHCYATTGPRIVLRFSVNGRMMGDTVRLAAGQFASVTMSVAAPRTILTAEIVKNNLAVKSYSCSDTALTVNWVDNDLALSGSYYARVTLIDGHMAFSSPVWCKGPDRPPDTARLHTPGEAWVMFRGERPLFRWFKSHDDDFGDLSLYFVECIQAETGRRMVLGPSYTEWLWADTVLSPGYAYRWRVLTATRDEPASLAVTSWRTFQFSSSDPFTGNDRRLFAYPNPFSGRLNCIVPYNESWRNLTVRVYDLLGRSVRSIYNGKSASWQTRFSWDGADDRGRACASGVYVLAVSDGPSGPLAVAPVLKLR